MGQPPLVLTCVGSLASDEAVSVPRTIRESVTEQSIES